MKRYLAVLAAAVLLSPLGALALPFSNLFVFGDSLSDVGNLRLATGTPGAPYFQGRFSNGPVYAEYLAQRLGLPLAPSLAGGTDFAFGGARTDSHPTGLPFDLLSQVADFRTRFPAADPAALYVVFIGANNLQDALGLVAANPAGAPAIVAAAIANAVGDIGTALGSLAAAGARQFLVPNLPNLGTVPSTTSLGIPALNLLAQSASIGFNSALATLLDSFGGLQIARLDTFGLLQRIEDNPAAFGFANATDPCFTGTSLCANPNSFVFFDSLHPSTGGHAILGSVAFGFVPEPGVLLLLAVGFAAMATSARRVRVGP